MLKIGLCDDHPLLLEQLSKILNTISTCKNIPLEITSFQSGEQLINFVTKHPDYLDIIFLDILMPGINGINAASIIRTIQENVYILFVTSTKDYALESYSVKAYSYILKPFSLDDIESKIVELYNKIEYKKKNVLCVTFNQDIYTIQLDDVIYFESNLRKIIAFMNNGQQIVFYKKLSDLEYEMTNNLFVRCHRSFLVNLMYIKNILSYELVTTNNKVLPISKKYFVSTRDIFMNYIKVKLST